MGEPLRALQELENSMRTGGLIGDDVIDVEEEEADRYVRVKVRLLLSTAVNY